SAARRSTFADASGARANREPFERTAQGFRDILFGVRLGQQPHRFSVLDAVRELIERCTRHQQGWNAVPLEKCSRRIDAVAAVADEADVHDGKIAWRSRRDGQRSPQRRGDTAYGVAEIAQDTLEVK